MADAAQHHHRDVIDSASVNDSGEMKPWKAADIRPDTPPKVAPHAEGQQLQVAGVQAPSHGGDLVTRAPPSGPAVREVSMRWQMMTVKIASARNR